MNASLAKRSRMIGVSIGAAGTSAALAAMTAAARDADIAELRLDLMREYDLAALVHGAPLPVIITNRPTRAGGRFAGTETDRVRPLLDAIDLGAGYVDIEQDAAGLILDRGSTGLIVSHHDFERMPDELIEIGGRLGSLGADVVKVAGMARRPEDSAAALELFDACQGPVIAIAMGADGLASRVLALRHENCFLTFCAVEAGAEAAPGQIPTRTMRNVYRAAEIGAETLAFGIVADKAIPEDLMAEVNRLLRDSGIDGVAVPLRIGASEVERLQALADRLYRGFWTPEGSFGAAAIRGDTYAGGGAVQALVKTDRRLVGVAALRPADAVAAWAESIR